MKAIGYNTTGAAEVLEALEIDRPTPGPGDLLVEVKGISVNPVDVKLRALSAPDGGPKVLGFDAAGVVVALGSEVTDFAIGDAVFYAGDVTRAGTNAAFHAVDARIVGRKPETLDFVEAASLSLTAITAWEMLFDAFRLTEGAGKGQALLVIGGAGGVGSILIQLAKALTGLTVIATASRPETQDWVRKMGADHVVDHRGDLVAQLADLNLAPSYFAALTATDMHWPAIIEAIAPRGQIALIDDPETLDMKAAKPKALSVHWEFMFTRSMFQTEDMTAQRDLLNRVAQMIDAGRLQSTVTEHGGVINVENLRAAHLRQESGRVIGKQVLGGW